MCKAAGRQLPTWSEDDVLTYYVDEAITLKAAEEREEARKSEERKKFRSGHKTLRERLRNKGQD